MIKKPNASNHPWKRAITAHKAAKDRLDAKILKNASMGLETEKKQKAA